MDSKINIAQVSSLMMILLLSATDILSAKSVGKTTDKAFSPYIIGGSAANSILAKHMAFFKIFPKIGRIYHECGGTIIGENYILTAAHCFLNNGTRIDVDRVEIYMGVTRVEPMDPNSILRKVTNSDDIFTHEHFDDTKFINDIAILKFSPKIDTTDLRISITKLDRSASGPAVGSIATALGWGVTVTEGSTSPDLLQVDLTVDTDANCAALNADYFAEGEFCTTFSTGKNTCQGDSGGPTFVNGVQVGITSYGGDICENGEGVYTQISNYIPWIQGKLAITTTSTTTTTPAPPPSPIQSPQFNWPFFQLCSNWPFFQLCSSNQVQAPIQAPQFNWPFFQLVR